MSWATYQRGEYPPDWKQIADSVKIQAMWHCIRCRRLHCLETSHVLTVHHLDGNKSNCSWWNLVALCQRCHLHIQGKVNLEQVFGAEHTEWFKPYAAGYYAKKYHGDEVTREYAELHQEALLALERCM